jgi:hypothetical protein
MQARLVRRILTSRRLFAFAVVLALAAALACNSSSSPAPGETPSEPASLSSTTPERPPGTGNRQQATGSPVSPLCPDAQPPPLTDLEVRQAPDLPEPQARVPFRDPVFGTCVVRVTDRDADLSPDDASAGLKNEYSRVQSFNVDGSRILVMGIDATWYLYAARTLEPVGQLPFGGPVEPRWDAENPDLLYYLEEARLTAYDVGSGEQTLVHDFAADFPDQSLAAVWTKYEGSPSADGRYWGLMAEDQDWVTVAFLVYDLQQDEVIAKRDVRGTPGVDSIDNAYISPLGNYFIADFSDYYCEPGRLGTDEQPCGYMVYDRELKNGRGLLRISGHMDLGLDAQGREVAVFQDVDTDNISMLDLGTGEVTPLWPIDFSHTSIGLHISGRAFDRPGWALVSTHDGDAASHTWMDDQVFAMELKPDGRVVRLAHTHSLVDESQEHDYWAEPHASANQDLTRVLFTSNWGRSGTGEVEMFMVSLPADWLE